MIAFQHWARHLAITTGCALLVGKIFEYLLERETIEHIVDWEQAQLQHIWAGSPLQLGTKFFQLWADHYEQHWSMRAYSVLYDLLFRQPDYTSISTIVLLAQLLVALLIVLQFGGRKLMNQAGFFSLVVICPAILVAATLVNLVMLAVYGAVLVITLPIFKLGVLSCTGGVAASGVWELCGHNAGVVAVKAAETATHEGVVHVVDKIAKLD
jgi:hypothetical protein